MANLSAHPCDPQAPVVDPLAECTLRHKNQPLYPITRAFEVIEDLTSKEASTRWTNLKPKLPTVVTQKVGRSVCCDEDSMLRILKAAKECPKKTQALIFRGIAEDTTKVREVVLHAEGGHQIAIEDATDKRISEIKRSNPEIAKSLVEIQVNGVGHPKLCADLKTMMPILWALPSNPRTSAFRMKCANDIVRQMKGDASLLIELEHNRQTLEQTGGLHFNETPAVAALADPSDTKRKQMVLKKEEIEFDAWVKKEEVELNLWVKKQEAEADLWIKKQEMEFNFCFENTVQKLNEGHLKQTKDRMEFLMSMGMACDRNKIAGVDRLNNYEARRYLCKQPALEASGEAERESTNEPMQVSEIMEFTLKLPADEVRRYANGAGGAVAKAFREQFGDNFEFAQATRLIDGCRRTVNAYKPEHLALAAKVIHKYIEGKNTPPATKRSKRG